MTDIATPSEERDAPPVASPTDYGVVDPGVSSDPGAAIPIKGGDRAPPTGLVEIPGHGWFDPLVAHNMGYAIEGDMAVPDPNARQAGVNWVNMDGWPSKAPPREWILPGFIPAGRLTLLYGPGGAGKTLFVTQLAVSLVARLPMLGHKLADNIKPVLYLCEDDEDEVHRRVEAICAGLGVDLQTAAGGILLACQSRVHDRLLVRVQRYRRREGTFELELNTEETQAVPTHILTDLRSVVLRDGEKALFVIDPLAMIHDGNENDRFQAAAVFGALEAELCEDGSSAIVLGHPSKSSLASGSTAWTAAARSAIIMGPEYWIDGAAKDERAPTQLALLKGNYASQQVRETLEFVEQGQAGWWRCITQAGGGDGTNQDLLLDIVRDCETTKTNLSPNMAARNYIVKVVREHSLNRRRGKRIMTDEQIINLVDKLRHQGSLKVETYRTSNRTEATRYRLTETQEIPF